MPCSADGSVSDVLDSVPGPAILSWKSIIKSILQSVPLVYERQLSITGKMGNEYCLTA